MATDKLIRGDVLLTPLIHRKHLEDIRMQPLSPFIAKVAVIVLVLSAIYFIA